MNTPDLKKSSRRNNGHQHSDPEKIDRLPPHSLEAEQGVLGSILLDAEIAMPICFERLKTSAVFYDLRHRTIYEALSWMYDERNPIDMLTAQQWLKDVGQLEAVGGLAYLSELPGMVPSAANVSYYADIVFEKHILRTMIQTCTSVVGRAYEHSAGNEEVDDFLDEVERDILKIRQDQVQSVNLTTRQLVVRAIETIEQCHAHAGVIRGLATGFADLDKMTSGFNGGEMIVVAARPGMGKTSLAMNIAEHVAVDLNIPVGVFSLEMTADSLMLRMLCSRARVNIRSMREGFLAERDFPRLTGAAGKLQSAPLHIDDTSGLSIMQLRAKARRMAQQFGIKLLVVDYLQLMHSTNRKADNRQQEIADISGGVKALAKELNIPVIALSQLNRKLEERERGRPKLSDLRESGAIEQDADFVGLLYKPGDKEDEADEHGEAIPVNLLIAKQRNGPTGDVLLTFLRSYTRFESAAKVSPEDEGTANLPYNES